jgi:hypothetical protein
VQVAEEFAVCVGLATHWGDEQVWNSCGFGVKGAGLLRPSSLSRS